MDINESFALLDDYRYLANQITQDYFNSKVDMDTIMDYAIDGLMQAVNSIESQEQLDNMEFKTYAEFYIKSEINKHIENS